MNKIRKWTKEEIDKLEENYGKIPTKEIVKKLDRTKWMCYHKACQLKLKSNLGGMVGKHHTIKLRKKRIYNLLGYKLLVIWSKELENPQRVTEKIIDFQ
jgi:hypothetical protein